MKFRPYFFFLVIWSGLLTVASAQPLRVVGSDLLAPFLEPAIAAQAETEGWDLVIDLKGTRRAMLALDEGKADVAILALPNEDPPPSPYVAEVFGFQVVTVVVNAFNPLDEISLDELQAIYAENATITNWEPLLGTAQWQTRQVVRYAHRPPNSVALELFKVRVLGNQEIHRDVNYLRELPPLFSTLEDTTNAIAIIPTADVPEGLRVLAVSAYSGNQSFLPTADNVLFGDYPLRMPFYLVYRADKLTPALREFLRFLYSDSIAAPMKAHYYQPLPENERRDRQLTLQR